jgi:hypothetical protein
LLLSLLATPIPHVSGARSLRLEIRELSSTITKLLISSGLVVPSVDPFRGHLSVSFIQIRHVAADSKEEQDVIHGAGEGSDLFGDFVHIILLLVIRADTQVALGLVMHRGQILFSCKLSLNLRWVQSPERREGGGGREANPILGLLDAVIHNFIQTPEDVTHDPRHVHTQQPDVSELLVKEKIESTFPVGVVTRDVLVDRHDALQEGHLSPLVSCDACELQSVDLRKGGGIFEKIEIASAIAPEIKGQSGVAEEGGPHTFLLWCGLSKGLERSTDGW